MILECKCGYNTNNDEFSYCPRCGSNLERPEKEYIQFSATPVVGYKHLIRIEYDFKEFFCNCGNIVFEQVKRGVAECIKCERNFDFDLMKNMIENPDSNTVLAIRKRMEMNGGYCPCVPERTDDTKCPCKKFREEQECCCNLYIPEE